MKMKKTEYYFAQETEDKLQAIDAGKMDDYDLPEFSKEVPLSSRKNENVDTITVEYDWKGSKSESIRVKRIDFRKGEEFSELYRVAARDGADSITFKYNNVTYIMRKTLREVAQSLYKAYSKIKDGLENIVAYIRTALGNDYIISKVEQESWAFDRRIAKKGINYIDVDDLPAKNKSTLCESIIERVADLHTNSLIIGRFTLNNILIGQNSIKLTDLRKLRVTRRKSFLIDELKSILQYLFAIGVATREDVYYAAAYYATHNEENCKEWYYSQTRKKATDQMDVVNRIEQAVYN